MAAVQIRNATEGRAYYHSRKAKAGALQQSLSARQVMIMFA